MLKPDHTAQLKVLLVGESTGMRTLRTWCRGRGLVLAGQPRQDLWCAVFEHELLTRSNEPHLSATEVPRPQAAALGITSAWQQLEQCREFGIPCVSPQDARDVLLDSVGVICEVSYQPSEFRF